MKTLVRVALVVHLLILGALQAAAQSPLPDERYVYSTGVDFYGSDLNPLFDTTQNACRRACSASESCVAFTFNARSNACFPKSAITEKKPYAGAVSAEKF